MPPYRDALKFPQTYENPGRTGGSAAFARCPISESAGSVLAAKPLELGASRLTVLIDGAPRMEVLPVAYIGNLFHRALIRLLTGRRPIKQRRAPIVGAKIVDQAVGL